jgi:hypothetical protein
VPTDGFTKDGAYIYALFEKAQITAGTKDKVIDVLDRATDLLSNGSMGSMTGGGVQIHTFRAGNALSNFSEAIKKMFLDDMTVESIAQHYRVHIQNETPSYSGSYRGPRRGSCCVPFAAAMLGCCILYSYQIVISVRFLL